MTMEHLQVIDTANLHHAYIIEDDAGVFDAVRQKLTTAHNTAEIHVRKFDSLGIDDSRELVHLANMRSLGRQLFICHVGSCTREAQNALLKLFEEPPERTHFFLVLADVRNILPTLRSRVWFIDAKNNTTSDEGIAFLAATPAQRIALLESIIKEKDVRAAEVLLQSIETQLYTTGAHRTHPQVVAHIIDARRVLRDKGASLKVLLESVAVTLPTL